MRKRSTSQNDSNHNLGDYERSSINHLQLDLAIQNSLKNNKPSLKNNQSPLSTITSTDDELVKDLVNIRQFNSDEILVLDRIASGGFAEVFKVKIENNIYAGKRMLKSRAQLQRNVDKFTNELVKMNRITQLGCTKILQVIGYCFDRESQNYWIITEYMKVGDLYSIIHCMDETKNYQRIRNEFPEIVELVHNDICAKIKLAFSVASCIDELHSLTSYAHLDVKSLNILIDENLQIRLGDWCDAKLVDETKEHHLTPFQPHGTIYWMAPEIVKKSVFCQKSDIFALSIVFCELLILEKPYPGMNVLDVKEKLEKQSDIPFRMNLLEILEEKGCVISDLCRNFIALIEDMWKEEVSDRLSSKQVVERLSNLLVECEYYSSLTNV